MGLSTFWLPLSNTKNGFVLKCGDTGKVILPTTYSAADMTQDITG